jgi:hypothetical protein
MDGMRGIKRLLLGIDITILGGVLVGSASGSGGVLGIIVAVGGLLVALSGMGKDAPA